MVTTIVATVCIFLLFMAVIALKAVRSSKSCCGGCAEPHTCKNEGKATSRRDHFRITKKA